MTPSLNQALADVRSHRLQTAVILLTLAAASMLGAIGGQARSTAGGAWHDLWRRTDGADTWIYLDGGLVTSAQVDTALDANPDVVRHSPAAQSVPLPVGVALPAFDTLMIREWPASGLARPAVVSGRAPRVGEADAIALDRNVADAIHLHVGATLDVPAGTGQLRVVGETLSAETCPFPMCSPTVVHVGSGGLRGLGLVPARRPGDVTVVVAVDLRGTRDQRLEPALATLRSALPDGALRIALPYTLTEQNNGLTFGFQAAFLSIFGVLATVAGAMLIGVAIGGAIRADTRRIGLLKAVGFTGRQIRMTYIFEYGALAVLGSIIGVVAAAVTSRSLLRRPLRLYGTSAPPLLGGSTVIAAASVIVVAVLIAALASRRANAMQVATALRSGSLHEGGVADPPRWASPTVGAALASLRASRSRSVALGAGLLLLAVTSACGLVLGAGFSQFLDDPSVSTFASSDLIASSPATSDLAAIDAALRADPDVIGIGVSSTYRVRLGSASVGDPPKALRLEQRWGAPIPDAMVAGRAPVGAGEIAIGFGLADRRHVRVGDRLPLDVGGRIEQPVVTGFARDFSNLGQTIITNDPALAPDRAALAVDHAIRLRSGADRGAVAARLQAAQRGALNVRVVGPDILPPSISSISSTASTLSLCLGGLTGLGVLNTVVLGTAERRRELALLKAVGMTARQIVGSVVGGAAIPAAIAGVVGVPIGVVLTQRMVDSAMVATGIGPFHLDRPVTLVLLPFAVVLIAVAGAMVPAVRSAREPVAPALRTT